VTIVNSVMDPDPTFQGVSDPDQTSKKFPVSDPIRLRIRQKVTDPCGSGSTTLIVNRFIYLTKKKQWQAKGTVLKWLSVR
jgi:hypothetical protein